MSSKNWTKEEAEEYLKSIEPILEKAGYSGKIVGSVVKSGQSSHDLDILLTVIPEREKADDFDFEMIVNVFPGDFTMDTKTYETYTSDGKCVDFCFDEKEVAPRVGEVTPAPIGKNLEIESALEGMPGDALIRFYHGTSKEGATKILKEGQLLPDDANAVGLATTYQEALGYATRKAGKDATVLEVVVKKSDIGVSEGYLHSRQSVLSKAQAEGNVSYPYFKPEVGGTGKNEMLVSNLQRTREWSVPLQDIRIAKEFEVAPKVGEMVEEVEDELDINEDTKKFVSEKGKMQSGIYPSVSQLLE